MLKTRIGTRVIVKAKDTGKYACLHHKKAGYIDLVGGGVEPNETFESCAYRETCEELSTFPSRPLQHLTDINYYATSCNITFAGKLYFTTVDTEAECKPERQYDLLWFTKDEMLAKVEYMVEMPEYETKLAGI